MTTVTPSTGKWGKPDVPQDGWRWTGVEKDPMWPCEMCEVEYVQYRWIMKHPDHPRLLMCHDCAREMLQRPGSWLARTWRRSAKGNEYTNAEGFNIVIFEHRNGSGWGARIVNDLGPWADCEGEPTFLDAR